MKRDKALKKSPAAKSPKKRDLIRSTRELSALLAVAKTATQSLDTGQVLKDTLDKSLDILGFQAGYIRILESKELWEQRDLMVRAARGFTSSECLSNIV